MRAVFLAASLALVLSGCANVAPPARDAREPAPGPALRFGVDTFAFPNESRAKNRGKPDLYANYCFVMARAVTQFQRFARFEPSAARVDDDSLSELVSQVVSRAPWRDPLPPADRVVIPGFASLQELSRDEPDAVKRGLGGPLARFWTMINPTNWRVVFPAPRSHQARVASQIIEELRAGRPVQLLITNFPIIEVNHGVVVYDFKPSGTDDVEFAIYDPNDPPNPGRLTFDGARGRFIATRLHDTAPQPIRAFRMYYWLLL
jgi:hypothetical protein